MIENNAAQSVICHSTIQSNAAVACCWRVDGQVADLLRGMAGRCGFLFVKCHFKPGLGDVAGPQCHGLGLGTGLHGQEQVWRTGKGIAEGLGTELPGAAE